MTWQLNESALKPRSPWMSKLTELIVSKEAFSYLEHKLKPKGPFWDLISVTFDLHVCPQPPNLLWSGKVLGWSTLALGRKFKCSCGFFFKVNWKFVIVLPNVFETLKHEIYFSKSERQVVKNWLHICEMVDFQKIEIIFTKVTFIFWILVIIFTNMRVTLTDSL